MSILLRIRRLNIFILTALLTVLSSNLFAQPGHLDSLLLNAVKRNELKQVKTFVRAGANVNLRDANNATVLQWAIFKGNLNMVQYLVSRGSSSHEKGTIYLDSTGKSYYGSLTAIAAAEDRPDILHYCIEQLKIPVDDPEIEPATSDTGWTALQWAARKNNVHIMRYLIDKGANVNARQNKDRYTPLHIAVLNDCVDAARLLIDRGSNIFYFAANRWRPIQFMGAKKLALLNYPTVLSNIAAIRKNTGNIYEVYRSCADYFIALDSTLCVLRLMKEFVDNQVFNDSISWAQYNSYLQLAETGYKYCGLNYNLVGLYDKMATSGPYRSLPVHYDYLKSQEVNYLFDLCMSDEISQVASGYFSGHFKGKWNNYSMMIFVSWVTSYPTLSYDVSQIRPLLKSLAAYANSDSTYFKLTKAYTDNPSGPQMGREESLRFKAAISGYIGMFSKLISMYEKGGKVNVDTLTSYSESLRTTPTKAMGPAVIEIADKLNSAKASDATTEKYLGAIYTDKKYSRTERLAILLDLAQTLRHGRAALQTAYRHELLATDTMRGDSAMGFTYLLMKIGDRMHEPISVMRTQQLAFYVKTYLDTIKNPNRIALYQIFTIIQELRLRHIGDTIDMHHYYLKFKERIDIPTRMTLLTMELEQCMDSGNDKLLNEIIDLYTIYLEDYNKPEIIRSDEPNIDYVLNMLLAYDHQHPTQEERIASLFFAQQDFSILNTLAARKLLRQKNSILYTAYNRTISAGLTVQCDKLNEVITALERVVRLYVAKNTDHGSASEQHRNLIRRLNDTTAYLDFYRYPVRLAGAFTDTNRYGCYIYTAGKTLPTKVELFTDVELNQLLGDSALYEIRNPATKEALYKIIWKPVEDQLGRATNVFVTSEGRLLRIPFDVIRSFGKNPPIPQRRINNLLLYNNEDNLSGDVADIHKLTAFGAINYNVGTGATRGESFSAGMKPLAGSVAEMNFLKILTGDSALIYRNDQATETAFRIMAENGHSPQIIHIASHGFSYPAIDKDEIAMGDRSINLGFFFEKGSFKQAYHPLGRCGFFLTGGNRTLRSNEKPDDPTDGIITGQEIINFNFSDTKLVVLSACSSALGNGAQGDSIFGVAGAFKMAGAKYVLAALWEIPDDSTVEFMKLFYTHLKSGQTIDESYHQAKEQFRDKYPAPYYWGAFMLLK